jgi:hypothetical protein
MKFAKFLLLLPALLLSATQENPNLYKFGQDYAQNASKVCVYPPGGWTIVNCSNVAAATSGALNTWSRYVIQCGVNSYIAWGDDATDVADANDGYLPAGAWLEFGTARDIQYVSCLNIGSDSDCRYIECK